MLLTGSQPPVVRATAMAIVFFLGRALGERTNPYNVIGVAALFILVRDGRQLFDVGFQLSFLAVLSLVHLGPAMMALARRVPGPSWLRVPLGALVTAAGVSLAATLGTLPVTALSFGKVSIIGLAANAVVVPATGVSVVLGTIAALAGIVSSWMGEVYSALNGVILHWTLRITEVAAGVPYAVMETHRFTGTLAVPYYALLGLAFHGRRSGGRRFFLLLLLAGLNAAVFLPSNPALAGAGGRLRFTVIDVGQGDALLVEPPDALPVLVDAGPATAGYDAGSRIVVPLLQRRGIRTLGALVVTHAHDDHDGGVKAVCSALRVERVIVSDVCHAVAAGRVPVLRDGGLPERATRGTMLLQTPSTRIRILSPPAFTPPGIPPGGNNSSIVLRVEFGATSFLLTGDAEAPVEEEMRQGWGTLLGSTVLKVAHHGGNTGTTAMFLDAVRPALVCISVGARNRHGHPTPAVLARLEQTGAELFRTDEDGAIVLESDGVTVRRVLWR
jgi:competence protein ComEC